MLPVRCLHRDSPHRPHDPSAWMGGDSHCSALGSQGCLRFSDDYFAFRLVINHFANDLTKNDSKSVFVDGPIVIGGYDETMHTEPIQSECQITGP